MEALRGPPCPSALLIYTKVPCFHRVSVPFRVGVEGVCVCFHCSARSSTLTKEQPGPASPHPHPSCPIFIAGKTLSRAHWMGKRATRAPSSKSSVGVFRVEMPKLSKS